MTGTTGRPRARDCRTGSGPPLSSVRPVASDEVHRRDVREVDREGAARDPSTSRNEPIGIRLPVRSTTSARATAASRGDGTVTRIQDGRAAVGEEHAAVPPGRVLQPDGVEVPPVRLGERRAVLVGEPPVVPRGDRHAPAVTSTAARTAVAGTSHLKIDAPAGGSGCIDRSTSSSKPIGGSCPGASRSSSSATAD